MADNQHNAHILDLKKHTDQRSCKKKTFCTPLERKVAQKSLETFLSHRSMQLTFSLTINVKKLFTWRRNRNPFGCSSSTQEEPRLCNSSQSRSRVPSQGF